MQDADNFTIIIEQLKQSRKIKIHDVMKQVWDVRVWIFIEAESEKPITSWNAQISDPFNDSQHDDISVYLNELLGFKSLERHQGLMTSVPSAIDSYQTSLLSQLKLEERLPLILGADRLAGREIRIEIQTKKGFLPRTQSDARSLQYIHWELLEEINLWMNVRLSDEGTNLKPLMIRVRRQIEDSPRLAGHGTKIPYRSIRKPPPSYLHRRLAETFKVLLVVARDVDRNPDPWSPTIVQAAVLRVREKYLDHGVGPRIVVKVVRPGSLERFQEILESDKFHVVHFDMHGTISTTANQAQLLFNEDHGSGLTGRWIDGSNIAEIVKNHGIRCVIIGACQSARADSAAHANLAWAFVSKGVKNVLAMSFNIVDTMSKKFFDAFYFALFVHGREFSEAAHFARSEIFSDQERWYYNGRKWEKVIDWFVPVVYSDGSHFFAINHQELYPDPLQDSGYGFFAFLTSMGMLLLVQLQFLRYWWRQLRRNKQKELFDALELSTEDRSNVLRLEHDLHRARSVFFNCIYEEPIGNGSKKLLKPLLKIWEQTHLVDGIVNLDFHSFRRRYCWRRSYGVWRIWFWRTWTRRRPRDYEPHLLVVIQGVDKLYRDQTDGELLRGRIRLESWIDDNFGRIPLDDPQVFSPYLIMVGAARVGKSTYTERVSATQDWIRNNLRQASALQRMAANVFQETTAEWSIQQPPLAYPSPSWQHSPASPAN